MAETTTPDLVDAASPSVDFWHDDSLWQVIWPAAIGVAVVVHAFAFAMATTTPTKKAVERIAMAISVPPDPPPPPPPEPPKPKKKQVEPPPDVAPAQAAAPTDTPPTDTPPPLSTVTPVALGPSTGEGVSVPVGTPDGVAGAAPISGEGPPPDTNRAQAGPPQENWDPNGYKSDAWDLMNKAKRYPRKAKVLGLVGKCMVKVMINHDGSLAAPPSMVGKGTGHDVLDEECLAMASRVKFAPIPSHIETPVMYRFPIQFELNDP